MTDTNDSTVHVELKSTPVEKIYADVFEGGVILYSVAVRDGQQIRFGLSDECFSKLITTYQELNNKNGYE